MIAMELIRPSGCRQPNEPLNTSSRNAATVTAAAMATPTATGANSTPGSGMRHGSLLRSSSTRRVPKAATSAIPRIAHAKRHARAISGAATTGKNANSDNTPSPPPSSRKRASRPTPSVLAEAPGTPTTAVQPSLPVSDAAHGKFAITATAAAAPAATAIVAAARRCPPSPPTSAVASASTTPTPIRTTRKDGAKANVTAVTSDSCANHRTNLRVAGCE